MRMTLDQLEVNSYAIQMSEVELAEVKGGSGPACAAYAAGAVVIAAVAAGGATVAAALLQSAHASCTTTTSTTTMVVDGVTVSVVTNTHVCN